MAHTGPIELLSVEYVEQYATQKMSERDRVTIEALKESISKEGIKEPLLLECKGPRIERKGVDAYLIEGNHRLIAAKELGMKTVPVRRV
jgi:ParB-like chromosome segregation protein Spo0J